MNVSLEFIIEKQIFPDLKLLAGESGLNKEIKRVSVFDCPFMPDVVKKGLVERGDFFVTCLEQFREKKEDVKPFIEFLVEKEVSGLLIIGEECTHVLSKEVLVYCTQEGFPILLSKEDIPYAIIMGEINKHIAIDHNNTLNNLKIEKIIYGNLSPQETQEIIYSINPNIEKITKVLFIEGEFASEFDKIAFQKKFIANKRDILIVGDQYMLMIISEANTKQLKLHFEVILQAIKNSMKVNRIGISCDHRVDDVDKCLEEGKDAYFIAKSTNKEMIIYDPLSSFNLLLFTRKSQEAHDFYDNFLRHIARSTSADNLEELLTTVEIYVQSGGDFAKTASLINQHENTIRYRMNKVRQVLGMENNNVQFFETISIAMKLKYILSK